MLGIHEFLPLQHATLYHFDLIYIDLYVRNTYIYIYTRTPGIESKKRIILFSIEKLFGQYDAAFLSLKRKNA